MRLLKSDRKKVTRVFFVTDVHGSERCYRKFLNAARVYQADAVILGGDLTGKILVPLIAAKEGWRGELFGRPVVAESPEELADLRGRIRAMGQYVVEVDTAHKQALDADPVLQEQAFRQAMVESLKSWQELADERLPPLGVTAYTMLGNDDFPDLVDVLRKGETLRYVEDSVVEFPGGFELLSIGYSNVTPWHTARELDEDELATKIEALATEVRHPERAIFNIHCPPYNTQIDQAPRLDSELRPVLGGAGVDLAPVGSTAVRSIIERYQPMLALHGHIHESGGVERIGETLCVNPGSEYSQGVLRGVVIDLGSDARVRRWQIVQA